MVRRFLPLLGALLLLAGLASVALIQGKPADATTAVRMSASATPADYAQAAPSDPRGDADLARAAGPTTSREPARALTGCGRPGPCPARSCEECPRNIRLR
jgi:hypothetical protein